MVSIKTLGLLYSVTWNPFLGECCNDPLIKAVYLFCLRKLRVNALFTVTCTLLSTLLLYSICIHKILNFLSTGIFGQKSYPHQEQNCEVNIWPPLFDWFGFVWFFLLFWGVFCFYFWFSPFVYFTSGFLALTVWCFPLIFQLLKLSRFHHNCCALLWFLSK